MQFSADFIYLLLFVTQFQLSNLAPVRRNRRTVTLLNRLGSNLHFQWITPWRDSASSVPQINQLDTNTVVAINESEWDLLNEVLGELYERDFTELMDVITSEFHQLDDNEIDRRSESQVATTVRILPNIQELIAIFRMVYHEFDVARNQPSSSRSSRGRNKTSFSLILKEWLIDAVKLVRVVNESLENDDHNSEVKAKTI